MARSKKKSSSGIILIKKANNLIESRYKFDIWETRFFLSVLSEIRREDDKLHEYRIWYKDVIKNFGLSSGDSYEYLRKAAKSLMRQQFFVSYDKEGTNRETAYQIIITADYMKGDGQKRVESQEYIDVKVHPEMKPFLLQLQKNFTAYDLKNVVKLGVYPVRIYELMKQYEAIGSRTLSIDEMKRMFELKKEYKRYNDFFRFVIAPAVRDINKHTDLTINVAEKIKEGRRVVALRFEIDGARRPKSIPGQATLDFPIPKTMKEGPILIPVDDDQFNKITQQDELFSTYQEVVVQKFGVTPSVFLALLKDVSKEQVEQAIRVTQRAKANAQITSNAAGFFVNALKKGFTDEKEEAKKRKAKRQKDKQKKGRLRPLIETYNLLYEEYTKKVNAAIREITESDPAVTKKVISKIKKTYLSLGDKSFKTKTIEDFRQDPLLRGLVKAEIINAYPDRFDAINTGIGKKVEEAKTWIWEIDPDFSFE